MRVSEILDRFPEPYLIEWKMKKGAEECKRISDEALMIGTYVDAYVQADINGMVNEWKPTENVAINNCILAWNNFKKDRPEFFERAKQFKDRMQAELTMDDLVGHPDFIFDDELPDLKTSSSISKTHWMQTAAYQMMAEKKYGLHIEKISILRLDKKNPNGLYEYKSLDRRYAKFWLSRFLDRWKIFREDEEFNLIQRERREEELLDVA